MRARFSAVLLALALAVLTLASARIALFSLATAVFGDGGTDWLPFYAAGDMIRTGHGRELFDPAAQAATQHKLLHSAGDENGFVLPAFTAYIFLPFSLLSFSASYLVWLSLNGSVLAYFLYIMRRYLAGIPESVRRYWVAAVAVSTPVAMVMFLGQVDLFVLACLLGCLALLSRDKPLLAGAVLALAAAKPQFALSVVLLLLVKKEWRALAGFGVVAAILLAVPVVLNSPRILTDQLALLASYPSSSTDHTVNARLMVNLRGTVTSVDGSAGVWIWAPPLAILATAAIAVATRRWMTLSSTDPQAWALALVLPLIYSPHVHYHSLVLLLAAGTMYLRASVDAGIVPRLTRLAIVHLSVTVLWLMSLATVGLVSVFVIGAFITLAYAWPGQSSIEDAQVARSLPTPELAASAP